MFKNLCIILHRNISKFQQKVFGNFWDTKHAPPPPPSNTRVFLKPQIQIEDPTSDWEKKYSQNVNWQYSQKM